MVKSKTNIRFLLDSTQQYALVLFGNVFMSHFWKRAAKWSLCSLFWGSRHWCYTTQCTQLHFVCFENCWKHLAERLLVLKTCTNACPKHNLGTAHKQLNPVLNAPEYAPCMCNTRSTLSVVKAWVRLFYRYLCSIWTSIWFIHNQCFYNNLLILWNWKTFPFHPHSKLGYICHVTIVQCGSIVDKWRSGVCNGQKTQSKRILWLFHTVAEERPENEFNIFRPHLLSQI